MHAARRQYLRHRCLRMPVVRYRHRFLEPGDHLVVAYPRSGSTWLRFMLYEALSGESAEFEVVRPSIPAVGPRSAAPRLLPQGGRLFGSHETYCDRPRPVVYLVRDPRSVALSSFHFERRQGLFEGTLDDFLDDFLTRGGPFGTWADHVRYWLSGPNKRPEDVHVLRYEDLRRDPAGRLRDAVRHLGVQPVEEQLARAVRNNTVERMKAKEDGMPPAFFHHARDKRVRFIRRGEVGSWRHELAPRQVQRIEQHAADLATLLGYHFESA